MWVNPPSHRRVQSLVHRQMEAPSPDKPHQGDQDHDEEGEGEVDEVQGRGRRWREVVGRWRRRSRGGAEGEVGGGC